MTGKRGTIEQRLLRKVDKDEYGCWNWTGYTVNGYGRFTVGVNRSGVLAHRVSYEWFVGPVPDGLDLDHLCRNRACINPDHLEPVTRLVNMLRSEPAEKTHCKNGHEFTVENTSYRGPNLSRRRCLACHREAERRRKDRALRDFAAQGKAS